MRVGLLEAGGGGGGAGRLGRPGPGPAREEVGGSGGAAVLGPSAGCGGLLLAFAALLFGGAEGLGAAARTAGSCPGLPPEKQASHGTRQAFAPARQTEQCQERTPHLPLPAAARNSSYPAGCPRCNGAREAPSSSGHRGLCVVT